MKSFDDAADEAMDAFLSLPETERRRRILKAIERMEKARELGYHFQPIGGVNELFQAALSAIRFEAEFPRETRAKMVENQSFVTVPRNVGRPVVRQFEMHVRSDVTYASQASDTSRTSSAGQPLPHKAA